MRITQQSQSSAIRADLASVSRRLASIQEQIASGRRLQRASDGPAEALEAIRYRRSLRGYDQYERNIGDAKQWMAMADTAMEGMDTRLRRARDLAIAADNGSLSATARAAVADEIRVIADEMLDLANTRHLGRPIFSGTAAGADAYDAAGTFLGDTRPVIRPVADGTSYQVNAVGPDVFGVEDTTTPMAGNVFQMLRTLADRIDNGEVVADGIGAIDVATDRIHTTQATLGARLSALEGLEARNQGDAIELSAALSRAEDVDLTDAILDLKAHETAYTAALGVTGRIFQHSLLDFLR